MPRSLSDKVKKVSPLQVSPGRYEFIELSETEPDLGAPTGPSDGVLASTPTGARYWASQDDFTGQTGPTGPSGPSGAVGPCG